jgi:hypothetical protein
MLKISLLVLISSICLNSYAQLGGYKSTENEGMNKGERFESIEKYLGEINLAVKRLEAKTEDQAKKIKELEFQLKMNKSDETKKPVSSVTDPVILSENKKIMEELKKLKADYTTLKNQDIEVMKDTINTINKSMSIILKNAKLD